jgi:uncharacterized protein YndB with AHSA1/START domain
MAAENKSTSASESWVGKTVAFTRVFDAPRPLVFQMWTDPQHVAAWWGPHGFTSPRCEWDARPGGAIYIDMKGPDGVVYPMNGRFMEIIEPERIVFTSAALDASGKPLFEVLNIVTFADRGAGKTAVHLEARVERVNVDRAVDYLKGMNEGWAQTLDRLAGYVATTASDREIVATRVFDARPELVFRAWSDPHHIGQWWGPKGFTTTTSEMQFKRGGTWRFVMHGPDGRDYPNNVTFIEIVPPQRIVYRHGGAEDAEPVNFEVTATFEPEGTDRTRLTMRMVFPSAEARDFTEKTYRAIAGLHETLGRLSRYVVKM